MLKKSILSALAIICLMLVLFIVYSNSNSKEDKYIVGISNGFIGNNWRNQMFEDLYKAIDLYKESGYINEVIIQNAGTDVNNQIAQIRNMIRLKVDLLMIDPNSSTELNDVIEEAYNAGIVVVVFDQNVTSDYAVQVTINHKEWGAKLATWLVDKLETKGDIVIIEGVKDQPCNGLRMEGMLEVLSKYPDINIIERANGDWDQASSKKVMTDIIHSYKNIDGVLSQDGMALGIIQAYENSDKRLPIITGEPMVAFIDKSDNMVVESDFSTYAITNPPGIGATALGMGLLILREGGKQYNYNKNYYYPVTELFIDKSHKESYSRYLKYPATYYIDEWMTIERIKTMLLGR